MVKVITETAPKPRLFYGYILAAYSFTVCFLVGSFFLHSRGIFFPLWMEDFNVDRTEIALVVSLTLFTGSCLAPVLGYLIDRLPLKLIVCTGAVWMAIGYLVLRSVETYTGFLLTLICFQGVAWGTMGPLVHTKLMVNWFAKNRGMALGIAIMGLSVAGIIMPTVATYLSTEFGWRDTYAIYSALIFLVIIPTTAWLVKQKPEDIGQFPDGADAPPISKATTTQSADTTEKLGFFDTYREFLTSKAFWSVVVTFGLMNGVYSAMMTHLPTFLTTELSFTLFQASYILGVAGGFAIAGKVVFGWLMDHFDAKRTVLFAVASYFASTLVFMAVDNYFLMMIAAALFGLGFGGMVPVRSVILSRLFGPEKFSRANGLMVFFLSPAMFWVLITGYIADQYDTYLVAFQVWAVCFLTAGIITSLIRLPNPEDAVG